MTDAPKIQGLELFEHYEANGDLLVVTSDRTAIKAEPGTIVSFLGQYLGVRFDGEKLTRRAHPTWRVERLASPIRSAKPDGATS